MSSSDGQHESTNRWRTSPELWEKLRPLARQKRDEPSAAEEHLWQFLRGSQQAGFSFRRQHPFERFIVDFYCPAARLVVEIDGSIHDYTHDEDQIRQSFLEENGRIVLRFTNDQVLSDTTTVLQTIRARLKTR